MSEEEKKTIEYLELFIKTDINYCRLEKIDVINILNVIAKQQKELDKIKALNIPIDTLVAEFERLENIEDDRDCNYISKDKIRETIEDLEKHRIMSSDNFTIKVLKDLIGD